MSTNTLKTLWDGTFAALQKIGKALMLPVSVLPVAGILLGVGASIAGAHGLAPWMIEVGQVMKSAGDAIFTILPLIFAIGVVLGFTGNDGTAAMAASVGYFVLIASLGVFGLLAISLQSPPTPLRLAPGQPASFVEYDAGRARFVVVDEAGRTLGTARVDETKGGKVTFRNASGRELSVPFRLGREGQGGASTAFYPAADGTEAPFPAARNRAQIKKIFGIESIDTGVFGGILIGLIAATLFNRYYRISLPPYLGFFAGKRFVPIVVAFASIALAALLAVVWPPIGAGIRDFGDWAAYGNPAAAVTIYGLVERMLLPFGLHHIWNVPFFFEVGTYVDPKTGEAVHGVLSRFFAGDHAAAILGGGFVFKMFGLPAAAFAIVRSARPENRARVAGIMGSAALTSFLTGITEPLEFAFLFVAPVLYVVHAGLVSLAYLTTYLTGARLGYAFSHGFIDYALYWVNDVKPWVILILGPLFALVYYGLFRALIVKLDLKTPGREEETADDSSARTETGSDFTKALVLAFGGRKNIAGLDACITRLRITVNDIEKASPEKLKALGAAGVVVVGSSLQAIFGPRSENLMTDMSEYLKTAGPEADLAEGAVAPKVQYRADELRPRHRDPRAPERARGILAGLGGAGNVLLVEACAETRVRVSVADPVRLDDAALEAAGVQGVLRLAAGVHHLLLGPNADQYAAEMRAALTEKREAALAGA